MVRPFSVSNRKDLVYFGIIIATMRRGRLLIVEDDTSLNASLGRSLRKQHKVDQVTSLAGAYSHVAESNVPYDVVILDRVLPDGDGLELLSFIRQDSPNTKICVTSSRDALAEKIRGLQNGADAYLPKPIHPDEISAYVSALLRRGLVRNEAELLFNNLRLNETARTLSRKHDTIRLSPRDTQLLHLFFLGSGRATHDGIRTHYWHMGLEPTKTNMHVAIQRLRQKLAAIQVTIAAVYGFGYELITAEL